MARRGLNWAMDGIGFRMVLATTLAVGVTLALWAIDLTSDRAALSPPELASPLGNVVAPTTAPPDASSTPIAAMIETYTVRSGDTLRDIARTVYGDELRWPTIYNANREAIADGDALRVGQILTIPRP